ncbi:MAG TPA: DUF2067 family protein [Methanofastidiosum sp.]|jgi:hypothetical protein|nr:DUF2067 family protein [Candidatus Methanofastidiosa archaeon]HOM96430.1 DUF2067 family protein [Methanofastidiosum sp.]HOT85478.1 DUF2067 family protein [Methanofastidiosum sp.]HPC80550.1 DUF2067 family protein [Methanofastidiosum sp.]HQF90162.1 DUF2067 family protein [Methanofastidiosum sp.]
MKGKARVLSFKIKGNQKVEIAHFLSKFEDIVFNISDDTLKIKVLNSGSMGEIIYSIKSFLEELKESEVKEEKGMYSYTLDSISKIAGVTVPVKLLKVVLEDYGYSFEVNRENVVSTASVSIAAEYAGYISYLLEDLKDVSKPVTEIIVRVAMEYDLLSLELLNVGIEDKIFNDSDTVSLNISYDEALLRLRKYAGE